VVALIPAPGKPAGWCNFECPKPPLGKQPKDLIVYRGASVYPWAELRENWRRRLRTLRVLNAVVLGVEVEVQSRLPREIWEAVPAEPANVVKLPPTDEQGKAVAVPKIPDYDGTNADDVRRAIDEIRQNWQWYFLTPPYYNVFCPGADYVPWQIHLPDNEVSQMAEPGLLVPTDTPTPGPVPEPGWSDPRRRTPPGRRPTPRRDRPTMEEFPPDIPFDEMPGRPGTRYPRQRPGPAVGPAARPKPVVAPPIGVKVMEIPDLAKQMEAGKVLIVFHDNTLKLGRFYRYRVRLVLLNPLLTFDSLVRDPVRDARTKEVRSPWSEWSDEVIVEDPTTFFLTGRLPPDQVRVTVFTRKLGQTVMKAFLVSPGMAIGRPATVRLSKPGAAEAADTEVDFSTGAVAVEVDFNRPFLKGSPGIMRISTETAAMLYLTRTGELKTRIQAADEQAERYKKLLKEATMGGQ